ncbi:hypothetical protein IMSAGC019_01114 [Lachnospiraceae bacterium]|nr:hypothetical protein IMSAGC019_01114 [Lachnospiraceae bacterium]
MGEGALLPGAVFKPNIFIFVLKSFGIMNYNKRDRMTEKVPELLPAGR